ncbi:MAG: TolC family protein [Campylobacterota bacterium]|nr:TolC family protein [Campylobacterota bacterium]
MIRILFLIIPLFVYGDNLKELMEIAENKNDLVISKGYLQESKSKELDSKNSAYFPTIDVGGFYKRDDDPSPLQPGDTLSGFAKISYDIYNGGKRSAESDQAEYAFKASEFDTSAYKKSLSLQIAQDFFSIKSLEASLNARKEAGESLQKQLERTKSFYEAKMATSDDVDRVQADFDTNIYEMESMKFQILSLQSGLSLKVGKQIDSLEDSSFHKSSSTEYETLDATKALISQNQSLKYGAEAIDSFYYPNIKIEDTYSLYAYDREDAKAASFGASPLENQNTLMLSLNFRVFDYGAIGDTKESVLLSSQALNSQISYQNKEQKMQHALAISRIKTSEIRIQSALSALNAATSAFNTIEKKYNAGIVDYIVYLDALTKRTSSKALYESGLNELEIAYAILYYYSGKNIKEELQ